MTGSVRTTAASVAATVLASLALIPAYNGQRWFGIATLTTLFVAGVGFGLRQLGTPRLLVPLGQFAALGWAFILIYARHDLRFGFLPSGESVQMLAERINDGLLIVVRYAAPVPYDPDLVMVTALGIGLVAIVVDTLSATFKMVPWAGLPLLLLYSIPATTVSGGVSALAFVPPAIGYVLLLVSEGRDRLTRWGRVIGFADGVAGAQEGVQTSLLAQTGRRVGAAVIGLAIVVPAILPTLPESVFGQGEGTGFGSGGRTIQVSNPIVDLRRDLRLPDNFEIMTYQSDATSPDYIRLVALDEFDGRIWKPSRRSLANADDGPNGPGQLPQAPGLTREVKRKMVHTRFEISDALRSKWLPAPYPAVVVDARESWGYDPDTLDLVAREGSVEGWTFSVTSMSIDHQGKDLAAADPASGQILSRYTDLPADVPQEVDDLAKKIVGKADNGYDQAVALQEWFRTEFIYDTDVQSGHGGSALQDFLKDKRGYCEQFAATMAIMARSLGIPARVAVGYMPGVNIGGDRWVVKVHDAHAWPELYFAGNGWVRFEPTPSQWTGSAPSWTTPESSAPAASPDFTGAPEQVPNNNRPGQTPVPAPGQLDPLAPGAGGGVGDAPLNPLPFLIGGGAVLLLLTPALLRLGIRRVRLSRVDPVHLAESAWRELADVISDLGLPWDEAATPRATGARLTSRMARAAAEPLQQLVHAVERTRYAPDPGDIADLRAALVAVDAALRSSASRRRRMLARAFPPSLWRQANRLIQPAWWMLDGLDSLGGRIARRMRTRFSS